MDDGREQDQYEERLKDVFNGFDASGTGSLCPEELSDLCQSLQLDDATPALLHALLQNQDRLTARVDFDQFKNALILVLSSSMEAPPAEQETLSKPESPEIQPKFVKGSKRYGRRSTPEFTEAFSSDLSEVRHVNPVEEENLEDNYDSEVPRKRERWNAHDTSTEEYEADGQMHLWNPDEPSTPRGSHPPWSCSEERLRGACRELDIAWDGPAGPNELLALCEHLGLEPSDEELNSLTGDGAMNVQEFVSRVVGHNKPPTPSASTPYRQLKRYHSTQPFNEGGRRIATPSALTSTIGTRLFSTLDDGSGFTPVEHILDAWLDEGIENSSEILQALNFGLDGKLSLSELTVALENELLVTKNGIHQAALASFKAEIRHLLERVDRELREKQKIRSDLEKAERLKTQLASEVDEHHSAIERSNTLNLRKLEQEHRERLQTVRSELMMEMEQLQQQAGLQREELEAEVQKIREDESFLRDHLSISVQQNRRLEAELLDGNDKLLEAQSQVTKLQRAMDNIMKERFGDLDPGSADFLLQEERIKQLRVVYEAQFRELQDRIDELQSELQEVHGLGRAHQACPKPLSEELESKSPGMESDPGIGPEEVQPFSMSLEVEMMLEQLKDRHLQKMEDLQNQLESKANEFEELLEKQRASHEDQEAALALRYQQEVQALREEMAKIRSRLERAELERTQAEEREGLRKLKEEEAGAFRQELSEAHTYAADLEETLKTVEARLAEKEQNLISEVEELRKRHADEIKKLEECVELSEGRLEEERKKLREDKVEMEKRLLDGFEQEKNLLQQRHEEELRARLEEVHVRSEEERDEVVQRLTEQWQRERAQLDEQNNESLQELLEEEMLRLVREQEEKESKLREQWESQQAQLQENHLHRLRQDRLQLQEQFEQREKRLKEEWERERLQLEEDYEGMLQERLGEERERFETEREEQERRGASLMAEERAGLEESHREAVKELTTKHTEERDALSGMLEELREDFTQERREIQFSFSQRIKEVEDRFSGDQESVHRRLQADVAELERHYQRQLETLSESLIKRKRHWEAQVGEALEDAEEQRRVMEQKQESLDQKWRKEVAEQERLHLEKMEEHIVKNQQLQNELEDLISSAQTKEIELSRQLNDLHNRLQESRESRDQLLARSEKKALETELLLHQTVEDFRHEREELLSRRSVLQARNNEMLSITERQSTERIELLTERDDLKMKIEELEMLLKRAAEELERKKQQEPNSSLEFRDNGETSRDELMAEINVLKIRILELEMEIKQGLSSSTEAQKESDELITLMEETAETSPLPPGISLTGDNPLGFSQQEVANYFLSPSQTEQEPPDVLDSRSDDSCEGYDENVHCNQGDGELEVMMDPTGGEEHSDGHSFVTQNDSTRPERDPEARCWSAEFTHESFDIPFPDSQEPDKNTSNIGSDVSQEMQFEMLSSLEGFEGIDADEDGEDKVESCEEESKPQDVPALDPGRPSHEEEPRHETVVDPSELEEMVDPGGLSVVDAEVTCLRGDSHDCGVELLSDCEHLTINIRGDCLETGEDADWDDGECSLLKLQALCSAASGQNLLLHEKISLLQQKTELLEDLLAHNSKKIQTGHQILEENYDLRVKTLLLMERVEELEMKASMTTRLHLRYEDCVCENAKLKDRNGELQKRVWSLECRMCLFQHLHDHPLLEEFCRVRGENSRSPTEESLLDRSRQVEVRVQTPTDLEEHAYLPGAVTELHDQWQTLIDTTRFPRNKAGCLTEENLVLREKLTTLKEEELQETQEELIQTLEHFKKWKMAAQEAEEVLKRQVSELCLQNQQLGAENRTLSEKDARHAAEAENLWRQLSELTKEHEKREAFPSQEKTELAACVCALEAELTKALEDSAQLEDRNARLTMRLSGLGEKAVDVDLMESQLSHIEEEQRSAQEETRRLHHQLVEAEEKAKTLDEGLQAAGHQSARLKSDLRVVQQERDSFKRDVSVLHKQLQNVKEKNHVLEQAMHSSGLHNQSKKRYREEISRLMEQDQQLLRQENEGLQAEVRDVKQELVQSRVKVRQLDAAILSLRQHKQSSLKALEQENASLKQELEAQKERAKAPEGGQEQAVLESLQQENEALRTQMSRLSTQLFDTFQAHFAGLLPSSPHRMPRAQHRGEELENAQQDDRARKMKNMEERMREIELSLRNVKLLLKEKVSQLKEQLHKNGKADVLISDLYVENAQLLKALEVTEQRQKIAEKKNYLLEEKISSLNKIVRDLKPTPLPALPYHYSCS